MHEDVKLKDFTMVPNKVLESVALLKLSATQQSLIYVIWRYTYGFHRSSHNMSLSFLAKATNYDQRNIQRELKRLECRHIITQNISKCRRFISFNDNYLEWDNDETANGETANGETVNGETTVGETTNRQNRQSNIGDMTVCTIVESDNQEIKKEKFKEDRKKNSMYDEYFEQLWRLYPCKKGKSAVSKNSRKLIYETGIEKMTKAIENYKHELNQNTWKQPMNGSTFFNGRYEDYLPAEVNKDDVTKKGKIVFVR